jgi:alpha-tubulin suppressor-like RCC1 family protein
LKAALTITLKAAQTNSWALHEQIRDSDTIPSSSFSGEAQPVISNRLWPVFPLQHRASDTVAAGLNHSLAVKPDGTVWAWGDNSNGEIGVGSTAIYCYPAQVQGLSSMQSVGAGYNFSVALKVDGTVWAWGANASGQIGDGTTTQRTSPVQVNGLGGVTAISAGYQFCLALKSDGSVWAWGYNGCGQLGDGTTTQRNSPV